MDRQEFCHTCNQRHDCQKAYEQLGKMEGPSVVVKVILAFLLPLAVFVVCLVVCERILAGAISSEHLRTALSFLLALLAAFACILLTRVISRSLDYDR